MSQQRFPAIAVAIITIFITYLNYSSIRVGLVLHNIYRELYYIPVFLGALAYGLKGAALSYILVFALYLPYVIMNWPGPILTETNRLLPLLLQGLFAFIAGYLVDREKTQRKQLEKNRYLAEVGRVSSVIVHDLKNPLIAILGFAERIKEGKGKTDTAVRIIIDSAEKMQKIVSGVLDFAGPIKLELKVDDIRDIIKRGVDSCRMKAEQRGVVFTINLPPAPVNMSVDSFQLERALVNLITNAIEASARERTVAINITSGKKLVTITIKDQGSGMDVVTLENIFIPFYTKKSSGSGLGMPIAKKVIEGHQGKIQVSSKPGQGTEVMIELPSRG